MLETSYTHLEEVLINDILVSGLDERSWQGKVVLKDCLVTECFRIFVATTHSVVCYNARITCFLLYLMINVEETCIESRARFVNCDNL